MCLCGVSLCLCVVLLCVCAVLLCVSVVFLHVSVVLLCVSVVFLYVSLVFLARASATSCKQAREHWQRGAGDVGVWGYRPVLALWLCLPVPLSCGCLRSLRPLPRLPSCFPPPTAFLLCPRTSSSTWRLRRLSSSALELVLLPFLLCLPPLAPHLARARVGVHDSPGLEHVLLHLFARGCA